MKCIFFLSLFYYISYSHSQFSPIPQWQAKSPCDSSNKNSLVEHFFNTIFTEFYSTPPICVCVQMCPGQPMYCYPNGCIKSAITTHEEQESRNTIDTTLSHLMEKTKNRFMLLKSEKDDFMTDLLERNYVDESKTKEPPKTVLPMHDLRPDPFKDKYSILGKYKKVPKVDLRYNLHDKVKNAQSDLMKVESWAKAKWPLKRPSKVKEHSLFSDVEKPLKMHGNYFTAMLPDSEVAEYPPKYYKRDLSKNVQENNVNVLIDFYLLDDSINATNDKSFSFEALIDSLTKSSYATNMTMVETTTNFPIFKQNESDHKSIEAIEKAASLKSTEFVNETGVVSMNLNNENVDRNKDANDNFQINKTANLTKMITYLAKQIELQNNTSMEIAKRTIANFDAASLKVNKDDDFQLNSTLHSTENNSTSTTVTIENFVEPESTTVTTESEPTTISQIVATKKNRQRLVKRFSSKVY